MSKKKKEKEPEITAEQKQMKEAVEKVNAVLKETGTVLQPYIDYQEFGIIPRVRISLPPQDITKTV
jgi:hypothetical protein